MSEENLTPENMSETAQVASDAAQAANAAAQDVPDATNNVAQQPFSHPYEQPAQEAVPQADPAAQHTQVSYQQPYAQQQYAQPQYDQQQQQYAQPQYQQPVYGQPVAAPYGTAPDPGTTPLVLGILSLVAACIFGFTFIGPIAGIVLGALGMSKGKQVLQTWPENGRAKGGRITGIIGLVLSILALIISLVFVVFVGTLTMQALEDPDAFISQMDEFVQYDSTGELQQQLDELEQELNELNELSQGSKPGAAPFMASERLFDMLC